MSSDSSQQTRKLATVGVLVVVVIAAYFVFRPETKPGATATAAEYVASLGPVVSDAEELSKRISTEAPGPELFAAAAVLESNWAKVRTGPGYDRKRHDDFIIVFGEFVTQLKSAGLIWTWLNDKSASGAAESGGKQLELLFTLQSLHGTETSAQLLAKRGLTIEQLLSTTNLVFEVTNGLAQAPSVLVDSVRLFHELQAEPTTR